MIEKFDEIWQIKQLFKFINRIFEIMNIFKSSRMFYSI